MGFLKDFKFTKIRISHARGGEVIGREFGGEVWRGGCFCV